MKKFVKEVYEIREILKGKIDDQTTFEIFEEEEGHPIYTFFCNSFPMVVEIEFDHHLDIYERDEMADILSDLYDESLLEDEEEE